MRDSMTRQWFNITWHPLLALQYHYRKSLESNATKEAETICSDLNGLNFINPNIFINHYYIVYGGYDKWKIQMWLFSKMVCLQSSYQKRPISAEGKSN